MKIKNRHSIRLRNYDYSSCGAYFVTICTKDRQEIFGSVGAHHDAPDNHRGATNSQPVMILNQYGKIADQALELLSKRFPMEMDTYQIMPNHIHMIIIVGAIHESPDDIRAHRDAPLHKRPLLSQIIGFFKMNSSKQIHQIDPNLPVWQRNYYEHIIRNEKDLEEISWYITNNPLTWEKDQDNLENLYF